MDIKLRRIDKYIWEIPKEGRMQVPVRVYASEKLLEKMKEDKTLIQAKNVASIPYIQKWAVVMPDGHEGYGPPVGGVGAFELAENTPIMPGFVGFDINCLPENTEILTDLRFKLRIDELKEYINKLKLKTKENNSDILFVAERESDDKIILLTTTGGREIELSFDHPVLTKDGWKLAKEIKEGEYIAVYPFDGVEYEEPKEKAILLSEEDFKEHDKQIVSYLKKKSLLPIRLDDLRLGLIARILGYLIGDGSIVEQKSNGKVRYYIAFYGRKEELERLKQDIEAIGFHVSKIYERKRRIKITSPWKGTYETIGTEYSIKISAMAAALFFIKLGAPIGKKIDKKFTVPEWIKKSPRWVKANFLAGLFSADGSIPYVQDKTAYQLNLTLVKRKSLENNLRVFLEEIRTLLGEFGITASIRKIKEYGDKVVYRLYISGEENIYKFLTKIGYLYPPKETIGLIVAEYLRRKRLNREQRKNAKLAAIVSYPKIKVRELAENLNVNQRLVERAVYEGVIESRIEKNFPSFEEFREKYVVDGIIYDKVEKVEIIPSPYEKLYDIGLESYHNFIANGVVVHNCGVRLLRTNLYLKDIADKLNILVNEIFRNVPAGVGETGKISLSMQELDKVLEYGVEWALEKGYAWDDDIKRIESHGRLDFASADAVSNTAKARGRDQLGTLGSGNHFLEIQVVDEIYDEEIAKAFGIYEKNQVTVLIHTGSRGLGHQVATDYLRLFERKYKRIAREIPDIELIYAPYESEDGQNYLKAMAAAANFAWTNRQLITYWVRKSFERVLRKNIDAIGLEIVYDVAHNIAKFEEHNINGKKKKVIVYRKGATRAFPPGHKELWGEYKKYGQPVIIPGSMGTASYLLVGQPKSMELSFGSSAHGAGRQMSRAKAKRTFSYSEVIRKLRERGIIVKSTTRTGVVEEVPEAYKDVDEVVKVTHELGISKLVARFRPIAVIKG